MIPWQCVKTSVQIFTQNYKCPPLGGARGEIRGSPTLSGGMAAFGKTCGNPVEFNDTVDVEIFHWIRSNVLAAEVHKADLLESFIESYGSSEEFRMSSTVCQHDLSSGGNEHLHKLQSLYI